MRPAASISDLQDEFAEVAARVEQIEGLDEAAKASLRAEEHAGPPLRLTAHVGEDFRHLMEGMRRIYEHVHYINGNARGRLGHAADTIQRDVQCQEPLR